MIATTTTQVRDTYHVDSASLLYTLRELSRIARSGTALVRFYSAGVCASYILLYGMLVWIDSFTRERAGEHRQGKVDVQWCECRDRWVTGSFMS